MTATMSAGAPRAVRPARPASRGLGAAAAALARCSGRASAVLAGLPAPRQRTAAQQQAAAGAHESLRAARRRFLGEHAAGVYDELTSGRTIPLRLAELAAAAAAAFPGLCPSAGQLAADSGRDQAAKEGYEAGLALFFSAVLADQRAGEHLINVMRGPTARALGLLDAFRASGRADLGAVRVTREGRAAHVTLANPQCLNAEDDRLVDGLETAVDLALLDDQVNVGILRGGPVSHPKYAGRRVFCAGINLTDLYHGRISFMDFMLRRELGPLSKMRRGLWPAEPTAAAGPAGEKPWLAVVDGFAIGGGMQLLLVADRVVAASDAYFSLPAAQEGIIPGAASLRLGRLLGARLTRQVILGGGQIRASAPEAALICDDVVAPEQLDAAVTAAAASLDNPAVRANRHMLQLAEEPLDAFRSYLAEFAVIQAGRLHSPDVIGNLERTWISRRGRP
jgi:(3,5-dihydroxyphenyl)acetyl-CoA 1,2-dioxygenase